VRNHVSIDLAHSAEVRPRSTSGGRRGLLDAAAATDPARVTETAMCWLGGVLTKNVSGCVPQALCVAFETSFVIFNSRRRTCRGTGTVRTRSNRSSSRR
jgi:hypothetical protein